VFSPLLLIVGVIMMRILIAAVLLCFSCNISYAKYCVKLPTCEELGYVFAANSTRRQILCPFDTDYALYLDYCQAYGLSAKPDGDAGDYQECVETKKDGTQINSGYYRYIRCNLGYTYDSGNCIETARTQYAVGDIYYHEDTAIGVVFYDDGTTTKIVALSNIDENGNEGNAFLAWGERDYNIPDLLDCENSYSCYTDIDGKSNTNIIVSHALASGKPAPAAIATNKYSPSICGIGTFCEKEIGIYQH